jgi:hypothetical protein
VGSKRNRTDSIEKKTENRMRGKKNPCEEIKEEKNKDKFCTPD